MIDVCYLVCLILFLCEIAIWIWTYYKQWLTSAREINRSWTPNRHTISIRHLKSIYVLIKRKFVTILSKVYNKGWTTLTSIAFVSLFVWLNATFKIKRSMTYYGGLFITKQSWVQQYYYVAILPHKRLTASLLKSAVRDNNQTYM